MACYQDAYISDIYVVVNDAPEHPFKSVVEQLKQKGVQIESTDEDENVVEGAVEACKVKEIDDLPGVEYVRTVFTYIADYPPGDPRDLDKVGRDAE